MKKIFLTILIICFFITGCSNDTSQKNSSYSASRTSENNYTNSNNNNISINNIQEEKKEEIELSSFSTKIYTPNDSARQNNITITCSKLNGIVIKSGETFSFCNTVGKATPEAGYQKADIFDKNGNTIKGYGGGNCQISSTLYNAVLAIPSLVVIERHEHSKKVYYVPQGKDAAVAYGSIDFKFRNDNNFSIKIYASNTRDNIFVKIVQI